MTVLKRLLDLPDVSTDLDAARAALDTVLADRALRRTGGPLAAEVSLRCAHASAELEGTEADLDAVRAGTVTDPLVQGALRVAEALPGLGDTWVRAPGQALARLHLLAARDILPEDQLGRPALAGSARLRFGGLLGLIADPEPGPGLLHAAVVHAELLTLAPFPGPNGVVARAAARLTLTARGVDPRGLALIDVAHLARQPEYQGAANAYATGTSDGVRSWLRHYAAAVTAAAEETAAVQKTLVG
ncbi:oxidoreductase [Actinocatenispora rupis]|uniref:Fido domain-containing protein n=1 Tax=Actinocatenispora rupis TaxID=519421 RepID=A0A8J3J7Z9_9ACTN|nr:oxidoreductase [Actinocatenispora rupis]GID13660.1 hypothetical protein Aru02nite_45490 [Actinocatenispora rupis]